jgi:glycosyltransferase involved in cell wall biosynthesis
MTERYTYFIAAGWGDAAVAMHFKALARSFVEQGHKVVYLPHGQHVRIDDGNLQVYSFPSTRPTKLQDFMFLYGLVKHFKPDCMIANFGASNVMTIVGWIARVRCRIDWYHTTSDASQPSGRIDWVRLCYLRWRKRAVYMLATHVVAVSEATLRDARATYHIRSDKLHTVYNALSAPDPTHFNKKPNGTIVCVGGLAKHKGQDVLIKAVALLMQAGIMIQVRLIGTGGDVEQFKLMAQRLKVADRVIFVGQVGREQIFVEISNSLISVIPSRHDALPYVVLESLAMGTPVIASAVGGIPEIIRDGIDGFLVPPNDPQALADKMQLFLSNQSLREEMGQNARLRFLDKFELSKNVELQVLWFEDLVRRKKSVQQE